MLPNDAWKKQILLIGVVLGALLGLGTAYLMLRNAEENNSGPPRITTGDALKASLSIIGIVRALADLGKGS